MECNNNCIIIKYFVDRLANESKAILLSIDNGFKNNKAISEHLNLYPSSVSRSISDLRKLGIVEVVFKKKTDGNLNLKNFDYAISDNPVVELIIKELK